MKWSWIVGLSLVLGACSSPRKESVTTPTQSASTLGSEIPPRLKENYDYFYHPAHASKIIPTVDQALAREPAVKIPLNQWHDSALEFEKPMVYLDKNQLARSAFQIFEVPVKKGRKYEVGFNGKVTKAFPNIFDHRYLVLFPVIQFSNKSIRPITTNNVFKQAQIGAIKMRVAWEFTAPKDENLRIFIGSTSFEKLHPQYAELKKPNQYSVWFPGTTAHSSSTSVIGAGSILVPVSFGIYPIQDVIGEFEVRVSD